MSYLNGAELIANLPEKIGGATWPDQTAKYYWGLITYFIEEQGDRLATSPDHQVSATEKKVLFMEYSLSLSSSFPK